MVARYFIGGVVCGRERRDSSDSDAAVGVQDFSNCRGRRAGGSESESEPHLVDERRDVDAFASGRYVLTRQDK